MFYHCATTAGLHQTISGSFSSPDARSRTFDLWMLRWVLYHCATASDQHQTIFRHFFPSWCQDSNPWPWDDEARILETNLYSNTCLVGIRYLSLCWRRSLLEDKKGIHENGCCPSFLKPSIFGWWGECLTTVQQLLAFARLFQTLCISWFQDSNPWPWDDEARLLEATFFPIKCLVGVRYLSLHWRCHLLEEW